MNILVAGGAGYIGSHTMVELLNSGHSVICVDNLYNSSKVAVDRVEKITGKRIKFYESDFTDRLSIENIFNYERIDAVILFAGYKAVGESNIKPLEYYYNNLLSAMNIIDCMRKYNCYNLIFSSSATVYGKTSKVPINEEVSSNDLAFVTNPYGRTKLMIEHMLFDIAKSDEKFNFIILRYFNPVGAHESGLIGEDPRGIPNNLMPYIAQVAIGKRDAVHVFGNDYKTKDGTGVRDYIHVVDLAKGHVAAMKIFDDEKFKINNKFRIKNVHIYNLGTGVGYSVLDVIHEYERASGVEIKYVIDKRREGDVDILYCKPDKALVELDFVAELDLFEMCKSSYNFQLKNPNGYNDNKNVKMVLS